MTRERVQRRVWFIDGDDGSDTGNGTFGAPFKTPGPVTAPITGISAPGDIIYILDDGGAGTDGGFLLKDDQELLGQGVPLELAVFIYVPATNRPTVGSLGTDAVNLASDNTIRGLNIDSPGGAGITGLNVGGLTIDEVDVTASGGSGVDLRNGSGVDINFDGLTISDISNPGLAAVRFDNVGGNVSIGGDTTITGIQGLGFVALGDAEMDLQHGGHLTISNIGSSGCDGVSVDFSDPASTVDLNGGLTVNSTNGGNGLVASGGTINILTNTSTINTTGGGAAVRADNTQLGITFDSITSDGGDTAISLDNVTGNFTVNGNTVIDNKTGASITVSNSSAAVQFGNVDVTGGTTGISLDNNDNGTFRVTGTTTLTLLDGGIDLRNSSNYGSQFGGQLVVSNIGSSGEDGVQLDFNPGSTTDFNSGIDLTTNNAGGTGFFANNAGTVNISGGTRSINVTGGAGVEVNGTSGDMDFGDVTVNGGSGDDGIDLTTNTGTFTFDDLDVTTTGGGRGLFSSDSGTVLVGNGTINSSGSGRAVDIDNTNLGITLTSVSANGAAEGIKLNNTTGSFRVTGDGGTVQNGSGGTIQNTSGNGITLSNVGGAVFFGPMSFFTIGGDAINSTDTEDLAVSHSTATGIGGNGFVSQASAAGPSEQTVRWINNDVTSEFVPFFASTVEALLNVQSVGNSATGSTTGFGGGE